MRGRSIVHTQIQVAVPCDADPKPVRTFTTFTDDLLKLRDWLQHCGVRTWRWSPRAFTGFRSTKFWTAGIEVCLVNARHCKNLPGRKTDVSDCQWLQYLHSVGLLRASFRPPEQICVVRSFLRQRANLVRYASQQVMQLHKALTQMNVRIHNVISDIVGVTGLAILDAVLAGERDGHKLAQLKDRRIKASSDLITRSLVGDWRAEHLFALRQALATWRHYQQLITDATRRRRRRWPALPAGWTRRPTRRRPRPGHKKPHANEPRFEARTELYRITGVELTQVPGLQVSTALVLFGELGPDFVQRFPTAKCFASWLGLCPDNRITGGRIISVKTRDVKSRSAEALRLAAQALWQSKTYLGDCFRRWKARLGTPKAITAMAHKLARILWHLLKYREAYNPKVWVAAEEKMQARS